MRLLLAIILLFVGSAAPKAPPSCTTRGTRGSDIISGSQGSDVLCGRGGSDFEAGQDGRDLVRGGPGDDTLVGGRAHDRILGRGGDDQLFAVDGFGGDHVRGGPGNDRCYGEDGDTFHCEHVFTSHSPDYPRAVAVALANALGSTIREGNQQVCQLGGPITICIGVGSAWKAR